MNDKSNAVFEKFLTIVPRPNYFLGRKKLLSSINRTINENNNVMLVYGMGGIGKTTTVLAYAHNAIYNVRYDYIAFFEVSSGIEAAIASNRKLQSKLGIVDTIINLPPDQYYAEGARLTLEALAMLKGKVLLIFDHVNDREEILKWKTTLWNLPFYSLFTSRAVISGIPKIKVKPLAETESINLFFHHYEKPKKDILEKEIVALKEILDNIQRHTLLIEMLASVARESNYNPIALQNFIKFEFTSHRNLQRTVSTGYHGESHGIPESKINDYVRFLFIDVLTLSANEKKILSCLAVLPSQNYSVDDILQFFQVNEDGHTKFLDEISMIHKKGLPLESDEGFVMHPVLRNVVLRELKPTPVLCMNVIDSVASLLQFDETKDNPIEKFPYLKYGLSLLININWKNEPGILTLMNYVGIIFRHMGKYENALKWCEKSLEIAQYNFGESHSIIAEIRSNISDIYWELGKYEDAKDMLEAALISDIKNFGEDHPNVAARRSNLGCVYRSLGDLNLARNYLEQALNSDLKNFEKQHPTIARSQLNLAHVFFDLSQYNLAVNLMEDVVVSYVKNFGDRHPIVANCQSSLGAIYLKLGNIKRARDLIKTALDVAWGNFGEGHPNIASHQFNFALVLIEEHNFDKALDLLNDSLKICNNVLEKDHPLIEKIKKIIHETHSIISE